MRACVSSFSVIRQGTRTFRLPDALLSAYDARYDARPRRLVPVSAVSALEGVGSEPRVVVVELGSLDLQLLVRRTGVRCQGVAVVCVAGGGKTDLRSVHAVLVHLLVCQM